MKRLTYCLLFSTLLLGAPILTGCATTPQSATASAQSNDNPYAGGNGAFGEDPANPGQYASAHSSADTH